MKTFAKVSNIIILVLFIVSVVQFLIFTPTMYNQYKKNKELKTCNYIQENLNIEFTGKSVEKQYSGDFSTTNYNYIVTLNFKIENKTQYDISYIEFKTFFNLSDNKQVGYVDSYMGKERNYLYMDNDRDSSVFIKANSTETKQVQLTLAQREIEQDEFSKELYRRKAEGFTTSTKLHKVQVVLKNGDFHNYTQFTKE